MKKSLKALFIISFLMFLGCATYTEDMKLNNAAYDDILVKKYNDAEPKLLKALEINPNNHYAQLNLGVVYQNTGRPEKALAMYNKVVDANANDKASRCTVDEQKGKKLVDIAKANSAPLEEKNNKSLIVLEPSE